MLINFIKLSLFILIFINSSILLSAETQNIDGKNQFVIKGAGTKKCGDFIQSYQRNENELFIYAGWLEGYLSYYNENNDDTYDITSFQSIRLLLKFAKSYCKNNENLSFYYVVKSLIESIHSERVSHFSNIVLIKYKDKSIFIYESILEKAKTELKNQGFIIKKSDSKKGLSNKELSGFIEFQKQNNIPVTGLPDETTLITLFYKNM